MKFDDLGLTEPLLRAVREEGYTEPTPIQQQAIPHLLEGKDLLGCAQTGTGKTAAFALPILQRLYAGGAEKRRAIRTLVLSPTRELAAQINESFATYGRHTKLRTTVVYGGVKSRPQAQALKKGVDILVATPGRLLDLHGQGLIDFSRLEVFVLDEADRMLDMGFIDDIRRIVRLIPSKRQTLLFSATMPSSIQALADSILTDPVDVRIAVQAPAAETVDQKLYLVEARDKLALLHHLLKDESVTRALVFMRTRHAADRVERHLQYSEIQAEAIHSDKPQKVRERTLANFKAGRTRVLVASDIASRGLDVDDVSHVINYDMPHEAEAYVHRIGRTGRAGATGVAMSFCSVDERVHLEAIEKLLRRPIPPVHEHPFRSSMAQLPAARPATRGWNKVPVSRRLRTHAGLRGR